MVGEQHRCQRACDPLGEIEYPDSVENARQLDGVLPPGHPVPLAIDAPIRLWNRWEVLLAFTIALAAEWLWRRHSRLV